MLALLLVMLLCVNLLSPGAALARHTEQTDQPSATADKSEFNPASLGFIVNKGQTDKSVRFVKHDLGGVVFFAPGEVVVALPSPAVDAVRRDSSLQPKQPESTERLKAAIKEPRTVLRTSFVGANLNPSINGVDQSAEAVNYLLGNDPSQWQANVPTFGGIVYQQLYPGIDLRYDSVDGTLKSTYLVAAGADPTAIRWQYTGAKNVQADADGNLVIGLAVPRGRAREDRSLQEQVPVAWQDINSQRVPVEVRYAVAADGGVSFAVGQYDSGYALTIDPILTYSTYLGGSVTDEASDIAVDSSQNIYLTGFTQSTNFPLNNPADSTLPYGNADAFVTKFVNGTRAYSTFLGGSGFDNGNGIAVDSSGRAYVAGATSSTNFPIVNGYDASFNSVTDENDVFVTRLSASGSTIDYSTYFGGTSNNVAADITLNGSKAYITGNTKSSNMPTRNAYDTSFNGGTFDALVAGFDTTLSGDSSLLTSSFLGGSNGDLGHSIAYDGGSLYIAGATLSTNFPVKNAYDSSHNGNYDIFVTKLSATTSGSSALQYSTYLGASGTDEATAITVKSGTAYITGFTSSSSFPIKYSALIKDGNNNTIYSGASYKGSTDAFVAAFKTTSTGSSSRPYSTFLGGSGSDLGRGIGVESDGRVTIVGYTTSTDFPVIEHWPMTSSNNGSIDVFLTKLTPPPTSGNLSFLGSGYLGGSDFDYAYGLAVDANGRAYITGSTYSTNFPTVNPQQGTYSGSEDVFVTKVFPEYTGLACRWAHTPGVLTTVYYKWGLGLEATGPGTWRTEAFEPGIASWNNLNNKIRYQFDATGSVTMRLYTLADNKGGKTTVPCSGGYTASADVAVNTFYNSSPNPAVTAHEQGHALSLGHISSATVTLMGNNPNGLSTPQALDDELVDTIYP